MRKETKTWIKVLAVLCVVLLLVATTATIGYRMGTAQKYNLGCLTSMTERPLTECKE